MRRYLLALLTGGALLTLSGCNPGGASVATAPSPTATVLIQATATTAATASTPSEAPSLSDKAITTASGLKYEDLTMGDGTEATTGSIVAVHYTAYLEDGTMFDTSVGGEPARFALGTGGVIPGWDEGVTGMRVGGKRLLIIPPELAFGDSGAGGVIPPNATLTFELELLEVTEPMTIPDAPEVVESYEKSESGLEYAILEEGEGEVAAAGDTVRVHYVGFLTNGTRFDSSYQNGEPIEFPLGQGRVIPGWDEGIAGMRVGERRQLRIPPELAYGADGAPGVIPPNSTLIFDVQLVDVQKP